MPRFYFDIDNAHRTVDTLGEEFADRAAATQAGMVIMAEVALDEARQRKPDFTLTVSIRDEAGETSEIACRFWQPGVGEGS